MSDPASCPPVPETFETDDEALLAEPKSKRQRVARVRRKPAAKPEASDEASEFENGRRASCYADIAWAHHNEASSEAARG